MFWLPYADSMLGIHYLIIYVDVYHLKFIYLTFSE